MNRSNSKEEVHMIINYLFIHFTCVHVYVVGESEAVVYSCFT